MSADMVALDESRRLVQQNDMANGDSRFTTTKMVPRVGPTAAWTDEMADIMATEKLTQFAQQPPPTLQRIEAALPGIERRQANELLNAALVVWWHHNTRLYYVWRKSIDLAGPYNELDLEYIREHFMLGDARDGIGLRQWVMSLKSCAPSAETQSDLHVKVANFRLGPGSTVAQINHQLADLLSSWRRINGNDVSDPTTFYLFATRAMAEAPEGSKMGHLHAWFVNKVEGKHPSLRSPSAFLQELKVHAQNLGMPNGEEGGVLTIASGNRKKLPYRRCAHCNSRICLFKEAMQTKAHCGGATREDCIVMNVRMPFPETATKNEKAYVRAGRKYVAATQATTLKGVTLDQLRPYADAPLEPAAAPSPAPAAAATGAGVTAIGAAGTGGRGSMTPEGHEQEPGSLPAIEDYAAALERHRAGTPLPTDSAVIKLATTRGVATVSSPAVCFDAWWRQAGNDNQVTMVSAADRTTDGVDTDLSLGVINSDNDEVPDMESVVVAVTRAQQRERERAAELAAAEERIRLLEQAATTPTGGSAGGNAGSSVGGASSPGLEFPSLSLPSAPPLPSGSPSRWALMGMHNVGQNMLDLLARGGTASPNDLVAAAPPRASAPVQPGNASAPASAPPIVANADQVPRGAVATDATNLTPGELLGRAQVAYERRLRLLEAKLKATRAFPMVSFLWQLLQASQSRMVALAKVLGVRDCILLALLARVAGPTVASVLKPAGVATLRQVGHLLLARSTALRAFLRGKLLLVLSALLKHALGWSNKLKLNTESPSVANNPTANDLPGSEFEWLGGFDGGGTGGTSSGTVTTALPGKPL